MKRNNLFVLILFFESLLLPAIILLTKLLNFSLKIENGLIFAVITTAVYVVIGVLLIINRVRGVGKIPSVLLTVALLLNQINALFFLFTAENMLSKFLIASWLVMTVILVAVFVKSIGLKTTFYVLSGILVMPICLLIPLSNFGVNTVIAREISPDYTYCAEVIDSDQGGLGGATILNVYKYDESFKIGSFDFHKNEKEIYSGRWGEYQSMRWSDDDHLTMNDATYSMSEYY